MTDSDNEFPASSFINIGNTLVVSGEIDVELKAVPKHSKIPLLGKKLLETDVLSRAEDPRWIFLNADENRDKYYYVRHGGPNRILPARIVDTGPPPINDILEQLGRFEKCELINSYRSNLDDNYVHYWILFENPTTRMVSENDELYYTDEPPVAGSVPLTINDIPPASSISKGGKTKKYRKKTKKYKTIRNIKNKKRKDKSKKKYIY
jgi:hypothetical protein